MLIIPKPPKVLLLPLGRLWNGQKSPDSRLFGSVELQQAEKGLVIKTTVSFLSGQNKNEEKFHLFFVEEGGQYLEVILRLDGSYSTSGFDQPNQKVADFSDFTFEAKTYEDKDKKFHNEIIIPNELFPSSLSAMNVFLFLGGQVLAYHPIFGQKPELHQPEIFPLVRLE